MVPGVPRDSGSRHSVVHLNGALAPFTFCPPITIAVEYFEDFIPIRLFLDMFSSPVFKCVFAVVEMIPATASHGVRFVILQLDMYSPGKG